MEEELISISPIDGRYKKATDEVRNYFNEYNLIKNRVIVEFEWLKNLFSIEELGLNITEEELKILDKIVKDFDISILKDGEKYLVLLGIENQSDVHYAMPVKNGLYDFMNYSRQVEEAKNSYRSSSRKSRNCRNSRRKRKNNCFPFVRLTE